MSIFDWFRSKPKNDAEKLKELEDAYEASKMLGAPDADYLAFEIICLKSKMRSHEPTD